MEAEQVATVDTVVADTVVADTVIVWAGLAGLYALYRLRQQGLTVVVAEAVRDVGGVWFWNRYPGARCDVESMQYSYSFSGALDAAAIRYWKDDYPAHRARAREVGTFYEFSTKGAMEVDEPERAAEYARRWHEGGVSFVHAFRDIYLDQVANDTAAEFVRARIRELVHDPVVAERLSPRDHPLGTKRICVGSDYYETFNRPNVTLVSIRDKPIERITAAGVQTSTAEYAAHTLVLATGYDALTGALLRIDIRGRDGLPLREKWADGPRNYLGLMVQGFPNLFIVTGSGSPSVLVNMVIGIEQHIDWIADCIAHMDQTGRTTIEPEAEAEASWVRHVNDEADLTLFPRGASWYMGANIPGKPRVFMPYVGGIGRYRKRCDAVAAQGYAGFVMTGA